MRLSAILILVALALPARATPPDVISLHDQVIGANDTHVFILRETNDNLGLYNYGMHDIFLVAKSIATGQDEEIWPVYRVHSTIDKTRLTRSFPLVDAINPFDILAARQARYISYGFLGLEAEQAPAAGFDEYGLWVKGNTLENTALLGQISRSVTLTSAAIQPYPEGGYRTMSRTTPQQLLAEADYAPEECSIDGVMTLYSYPQPDVELVRVICNDEDAMLRVVLVVIMPQ
ncbi:MAG: hypothetical protein L3J37_11420 [Rhodobacteraceae bacterium]|nr:hypothetical protein [Paracoccaceae bacterium]